MSRRNLQLVTRLTGLTQTTKGILCHSQSNDYERVDVLPGSLFQVQDDISVVLLLKACAKQKDLRKGSKLHAHILDKGLLIQNIYIGNTLIHMFAKCGALDKAQEVFDQLAVRDVVSWTAMVTAHAQHACYEQALDCFEQMLLEGIEPDAMTFASVLNTCGSVHTVERGEAIHAEIVMKGLLEKDIVLGNALVDMYAKCGAPTKAQQVFDELPNRDIISWNSLITGYCQHGYGEEALNCLEQMKVAGISPDEATFASLLQACGGIGAEEKGKELHAEIARKSLLMDGVVLGNALVDMYGKCGALVMALQVFGDLPARDLVSWSALIAGYCQHGHGEQALHCFQQMKGEGVVSPDSAIFACLLKACGSIGSADRGQEIHSEIVKEGLLGETAVLGSALVDMYSKCGAMARSQQLFDEIRARNIISWNALITGYCQHGHGEEALKCLGAMKSEGFFPDGVTMACILKACGTIGADGKGEELHAEILRNGLWGSSAALGNALVDMYAKCGALARAQDIFYEMPARNLVSWNAMITGYCQHGCSVEALNQYKWLTRDGLLPDTITFACLLKACANLGAACKGKEIHAEIARMDLLRSNIMLGNALVDMYGKCGVLAKARQVFAELSARDVVTWNALIAGYCEYGWCSQAFDCLEQMKRDGISPDAVTYTSMLKGCSSIGATEKGHTYFEEMSSIYGIARTVEHHTCMVDLLSRAGDIDKAVTVLKKMPSSDYFPVWCALLGACRKWENVKFGELAFKHAVRLDKKSAIAYAFMGDIYMAAGLSDYVEKI